LRRAKRCCCLRVQRCKRNRPSWRGTDRVVLTHGACYKIVKILAALLVLNLIKESNNFWSQSIQPGNPPPVIESARILTATTTNLITTSDNNPVTIITSEPMIIPQPLYYIKRVLPIMLSAITYLMHPLLIGIACAIHFIFRSVLDAQTAWSLLAQANTLLQDGYNTIHESESLSQIAAATQIIAINLIRVICEYPGTSSILAIGYYLYTRFIRRTTNDNHRSSTKSIPTQTINIQNVQPSPPAPLVIPASHYEVHHHWYDNIATLFQSDNKVKQQSSLNKSFTKIDPKYLEMFAPTGLTSAEYQFKQPLTFATDLNSIQGTMSSITDAAAGRVFEPHLFLTSMRTAATTPNNQVLLELSAAIEHDSIHTLKELLKFMLDKQFVNKTFAHQRLILVRDAFMQDHLHAPAQLDRFLTNWADYAYIFALEDSSTFLHAAIEFGPFTLLDHKEYLHQLADTTSTVNEFLQLIRNSKHKDLFFSSDQAKKHKDLLDPANQAHPTQRNPPRHFNKSNSKQTKQLNDKPATSDTAPPTHAQGTLRNLVGIAQTATPLATIPNLHKLQNALPIIDVHIANDMETSPSLPALLDSGATHSVISSNIVQNLLLSTYCCADQPWFDIRTFREASVGMVVGSASVMRSGRGSQ
jgi:hypothetical protein